MSDKVIDFDKRKPNKGLMRRVLTISLIALVVLGILAMILFPGELNLDAVRRWVRYLNVRGNGSYGEYAYDAHNSNRYAALEDGLALASVGGMVCYSSDGVELTTSQAQMTLPVLQSAGKIAMSYDAGGNILLLNHGEKGELLRIDSPSAIYDADLASDGSICYISSNSGHKSVLSVYDPEQVMIYRWLSSSSYLPQCAVSAGGKLMAAIGLGQADGEFESRLYLYDTTMEEPKLSVGLGNDLIYDLDFFSEQVLCAVGEASASFVNVNGQITGTYFYEGQYLKDYDLGGNGFLTLLLNMYKAGNRCTLITVDKNGKQVGSVYIGQEVLDISAAGRYVAVLTGDGLTIYNEKLHVYASTAETGNASSVVMRNDGTVLLLSSGNGRLYIP